MKKALLTLVAALAFTGSYAQQVKSEKMSVSQLAEQAVVAPVAAAQGENVAAFSMAPQKTIANGVSYSRPAGTYWSWWGEDRSQMYIPAFTTVKWVNQSTNKNGAWTQEYEDKVYELEADENGDCEYEIFKVNNGYISPYGVPYLTFKGNKYIYGQETGFTPWLLNGDEDASVCKANGAAGFYYGFSDGCVFGTMDNQLTIDGNTVDVVTYRVRDFYEKPLAPLCINSIEFNVVSYNATLDMIPEGKELKLHIIRAEKNENNHFTETTDTIATMTITKDNLTEETELNDEKTRSFNHVLVEKIEKDIFGVEYTEPVIVNDPFLISIEGWNQEGVDLGIYMIDVMSTERDYFANGGVYPTLYDYIDADGNKYDGYWQYRYDTNDASRCRQYNAAIFLNVVTDIVDVVDGFETMTAPEEGGNIYADIEETNDEGETETVRYGTVQFRSTRPWITVPEEGGEGYENYYFEDMPDWLSFEENIDTYYKAENDFTNLIKIVAEPLPEGMEGRKAEFRIVSDSGADSGIITVIQGNPVVDGIATVTDAAKTKKHNAVYNLAGQQVSNQYKGLVIENGKKIVK